MPSDHATRQAHVFTTSTGFRQWQGMVYIGFSKMMFLLVEVESGSISMHQKRYGATATFQTRPYNSMATLRMITTMDEHTAARTADVFTGLSSLTVVECTSSNSRATSIPYTTRH